MDYYLTFSDKCEALEQVFVNKSKIKNLKQFKEILSDLIQNHPLTKGKLNNGEIEMFVKSISDFSGWKEFNIKDQLLNIYWNTIK